MKVNGGGIGREGGRPAWEDWEVGQGGLRGGVEFPRSPNSLEWFHVLCAGQQSQLAQACENLDDLDDLDDLMIWTRVNPCRRCRPYVTGPCQWHWPVVVVAMAVAMAVAVAVVVGLRHSVSVGGRHRGSVGGSGSGSISGKARVSGNVIGRRHGPAPGAGCRVGGGRWQVAGGRWEVAGTRGMAHVAWVASRGSCSRRHRWSMGMEHGAWSMLHGSWIMADGAWCTVHSAQ